MEQLELLYEGKAKQVFATDDPERIIIRYKDSATAYNNLKKATIVNKGVFSNDISSMLFRHLADAGVETHFIGKLNGAAPGHRGRHAAVEYDCGPQLQA